MNPDSSCRRSGTKSVLSFTASKVIFYWCNHYSSNNLCPYNRNKEMSKSEDFQHTISTSQERQIIWNHHQQRRKSCFPDLFRTAAPVLVASMINHLIKTARFCFSFFFICTISPSLRLLLLLDFLLWAPLLVLLFQSSLPPAQCSPAALGELQQPGKTRLSRSWILFLWHSFDHCQQHRQVIF